MICNINNVSGERQHPSFIPFSGQRADSRVFRAHKKPRGGVGGQQDEGNRQDNRLQDIQSDLPEEGHPRATAQSDGHHQKHKDEGVQAPVQL